MKLNQTITERVSHITFTKRIEIYPFFEGVVKVYKSFGIGIVISVLVLLQATFADFRNEEMFTGLLSLIAVGLFGFIWKKESKKDGLGPVLGIGIIIFIIFFMLADNTLVGSEIMIGIALSFIVAGVFGLMRANE